MGNVTTINKLKGYLSASETQENLKRMLGKKAQGFATSVLSTVNNNTLLQRAEPSSVYSAAMIAASLDLPINQSLGFAAIVPYGDKAQFQIMTRGLIQLAMRSGEYKTINCSPVYEGQMVKQDPFTGEYEFQIERTSDKLIGYVAYFKMLNGFEKYLYMTVEELRAHGKKYSKSYSRANGLWQTNEDAMFAKTVLKLLLSKYGMLSIEMQRAIKFDQSKVNLNSEDIDESKAEYIDNEDVAVDEEKKQAVADKFKDLDIEDVSSEVVE